MYKILNEINKPEDFKDRSVSELNRLSVELRDFLLNSISKTGGHLASNLGVVELTIALHYVFDSPADKLIWDVGHQCYSHKILTGRRNEFENLRQLNGISGFIKKKESEHDIFQAGHTSTSISSAIGMAKARDFDGENYDIIPIIGDGAMTGGMAFEALNYLGQSKEKIIVVLNDNGMSIDKNVGALSKCLSNLRTSKTYGTVKNDTKLILDKIPKFGKNISSKVSKIKNSLKYMVLPNMLFEELGFTYLGPVDGHNLETLVSVLERAKKTDGPIIVHAITKKGKGYKPAEDSPEKFHGVGKFDLKGKDSKKISVVKYSDVFGKKICEMAENNDKIYAITAAMPGGTGLNAFKNKFPKRYIDVGIAEQNATTIAAGLANAGKKPFFAVYSTFLQRAYDQILHDICIQKLPVVICIDRAGLVGFDGETHHGVFDISFLSSMPNLMILAPKDGNEFERMLSFAAKYDKGPIAIRYPRGETVEINKSRNLITNYETLREGNDVAIIAVGKMVDRAIKVADILIDDGVSVKLINPRVIKPINYQKLVGELQDIDHIVTLEDNMLIGGFGSMISQNLCNKFKILNLGYDDEFIEHGDTNKLFEVNKLDINSIYNKIIDFMGG